MSDQQNTISGFVVMKPGGEMYFVPEKVLEGFRVEDPAGRKVLHEHIGAEPAWRTHLVAVDRKILFNAGFLF